MAAWCCRGRGASASVGPSEVTLAMRSSDRSAPCEVNQPRSCCTDLGPATGGHGGLLGWWSPRCEMEKWKKWDLDGEMVSNLDGEWLNPLESENQGLNHGNHGG